MSTEIYGTSDDLIEIEGDITGELNADDAILFLSDGTILHIKYGKADMAVWEMKLIEKGSLFETIEPCFDEGAPRYSDTAKFGDGIKWAFHATSIRKVE